ncbi:MAG: hypothetical protein M1830_004006, partial [Pleopsidium flavum]
MDDSRKRKSIDQRPSAVDKKRKGPKQWQVPRRGESKVPSGGAIEAGDAGIWATCAMGREGKCTAELRDIFNEYAEKLYGSQGNAGNPAQDSEEEDLGDIEAEIKKEVEDIRKPSKEALFQSKKVDVQC